MRGKIQINLLGGRKHKVKIRYLILAIGFLGMVVTPNLPANADSCPDLRIVFARGSGGDRWSDQNYLAFKNTIEEKIKTTNLKHDFIDLDYPAIGIGLENLGVALGAYLGAGDAYKFGESVDTGVKNLTAMVNGSCKNTKYVIGGYSQGAMVISKALKKLNAERVVYAATFGDPKIYLPEGKGLIPPACRNQNLSDYRMYVPDCQAYKGLLGAYTPYAPKSLAGRVGTWCNKRDIFCSSHLSVSDHTAYVAENLYEDASRVIFDKIAQAFNLENRISSPHDTAILIDSTGSMSNMIEKYKKEALRLATETLNSGGRVALFDYRDLADPYDLVKHCDFTDCNLSKFQQELDSIRLDGGGDDAESLLSASFHAMQSLNWQRGATKSLVILTDANFLSPDRDGMTFDEVVALSKRIDPVNFYIITNAEHGSNYEVLAGATDGKVVTDFNELSLLTDYILERYDSLPRVEDNDQLTNLPSLSVTTIDDQNTEVLIKFNNTGNRALVILNDKILGVAESASVKVGELDRSRPNTLTLVPLGEDTRGDSVNLELDVKADTNLLSLIPKVPNAGKP